LLVQHFLDKLAKDGAGARPAKGAGDRGPASAGQGAKPVTVSQDAMRRLMADHWPGNVPQLENAVERARACSAGRGQIDVADLPDDIQHVQEPVVSAEVTLPEDGLDLDEFVANIERELIRRSLERTGGNKGAAAKLLHLKRTTLVEKLKRLQ